MFLSCRINVSKVRTSVLGLGLGLGYMVQPNCAHCKMRIYIKDCMC